MGGDGGFVGKGHLALHCRYILGKGGCGRVRNSSGHRRRRGGPEHEDVWSTANAPGVGGIDGELDFAKDGTVRRCWEGD
jgi:hypothetical protein